MLKSSESKSLLALAKALLSLQRAKQAQPALKRENLYFALKDSFKSMILRFLEEKGITILKKEEKTEEELDTELMKIALKEENKDKCFLTIAETLKAPLWVFEGKVIQSKEGGMKFEEDLAKLYQPQGKNPCSLAVYYSPTTSEFFRVALIDPQGLDFLTSCQDSELRNVELELFSPWVLTRLEIKALLDTKSKFVTDKLRTLPKMRKDPVLGGKYYMKHTAARYITHGSMANSCAEKISTDMPSPALCAQTVHRGYRHSGFDFTSQYEQIPASTVTSLLHTIGFDGKEYSPLSAPQGAHHSPVAGQCVSNSLMKLIDDSLISQYICKPIIVNAHPPYGTGHDYRPPTVKATYDDVADLNSPHIAMLRRRVELEASLLRPQTDSKFNLNLSPTGHTNELIDSIALLDDINVISDVSLNQRLGEDGIIEADPLEEGSPKIKMTKSQLHFKIHIMAFKQLITNCYRLSEPGHVFKIGGHKCAVLTSTRKFSRESVL